MKLKKILAGVLTCVTVIGLMGASVLAADTTTITVNGVGSQYKAWRLMDVEQTLKGTCSHAEGEHTEDCYDWTYTENEKYKDVIAGAKTAAAQATPLMAPYLSYPTDEFLREMKSSNTDAFEKTAWESLKDMEADAVSTTGTFENIPTGWYFIAETEKGESPDYYSLHMVNTAGKDGLTINSKEEEYTVRKFTVDKEEVKVGDTVTYTIRFCLPQNIYAYMTDGRYGSYTATFHNVTAPGVKLNLDNNDIHVFYEDQELVNSRYRTLNVDTDNNSFDLTQVLNQDSSDTYKNTPELLEVRSLAEINVQFTGVVQDVDAFSNWVSEAWITFPNDPYDLTHTDDTPHMKVGLFTYELNVNPVNKAGNAVSGVEYTLEKKNGENWETITSTADGGVINFAGLASGDYRLSETKTPAGYGKHEDILFTLTPEYEGHELKSIGVTVNGEDATAGENPLFTADPATGVLSTTFVYGHTTQLPATGAMSLIILLGVGACMVAAGAADTIRGRNKR